MNIEKYVNSKWYNIVDNIYRLIMINLMIIIFSIPVITFLSAITAGFDTIKSDHENKSSNVFKTFFNCFKRHFKKSIVSGLIILAISIVFLFAILNYLHAFEQGVNLFFTIGFYFLIFCCLILIFILFHLPIVISYFNFRIFDNIKFSFYMSIKYLISTLLILIVWFLCGVVFYIAFPVGLMIGISGALNMVYKISRPTYWYIANNANNVEEEEYDYKGEE